MNPPYHPSYILNSNTTVLQQDGFMIKLTLKVDLLLNKETKLSQALHG